MIKIQRDQFLTYDGIKLVSLYSVEPPYNRDHLRDVWHIPGRQIMTTDALREMALRRKVTLNRTELSGGIVTTTHLI